MKHTLLTHNDCDVIDCPICEGGLAVCTVCGGTESSLTTDCCGRQLTDAEHHTISNGALDYKNNQWTHL